jgi:hypothetical protein
MNLNLIDIREVIYSKSSWTYWSVAVKQNLSTNAKDISPHILSDGSLFPERIVIG